MALRSPERVLVLRLRLEDYDFVKVYGRGDAS